MCQLISLENGFNERLRNLNLDFTGGERITSESKKEEIKPRSVRESSAFESTESIWLSKKESTNLPGKEREIRKGQNHLKTEQFI